MDGPLNGKYILTGQTHIILRCILLNGVLNYILTFTALKVQAHMVFTVLRVFITPYYHLARGFLEQGFFLIIVTS